MKYTALVFKNLVRSKRRTFLTVLSIAVSLFIFSALVSVPTVADQILGNTASSTRIAMHNKAGLAYSIPIAYKQRVATLPHVEVVVPESWFGGVYHEVSDQFPNLAADPENVDKMWPDWGISPEQFEQFKKIRTAALVGDETMKRFHLHLGQQIQLRGYALSVQRDAANRRHDWRQGAAEFPVVQERLPRRSGRPAGYRR